MHDCSRLHRFCVCPISNTVLRASGIERLSLFGNGLCVLNQIKKKKGFVKTGASSGYNYYNYDVL